MKRVHIIPNTFDQNTWSVEEVDDVLVYLKQQFTVLPENTRIYHNSIAPENDVTPIDERGVRNLQALDGDIYVVIEPGYDPFTIAYLVIAAITLAFSVYTYMTMPKPSAPNSESPNNQLSSRSNQIRLNSRIPDIFGELRAYPDLIAQPYVFFDEASGKEIEYCLMVLGRGYYQIHDVCEGFTEVNSIEGTSVSIYNPGDSLTGAPFFKIGENFSEGTIHAQKSEAINGQNILKPNDQVLESNAIWFEYPNKIKTNSNNFVVHFGDSAQINIENAQFGVPNQTISGAIKINNLNQVIITSSKDIADVGNFKGLTIVGALVDIEVTQGEPPQTTKVKVDLSGNFNASLITKTIVNDDFVYTVNLLSPEHINPNWAAVNKEYSITAGLEFNKNINSLDLDGTYNIQVISSTEIHILDPNEQWLGLQNLQVGSTIGQNVSVILSTITDKYIGWYNLNMPTATEFSLNILFTNGLYWQSRSGRRDPQRFAVKIEYQKIDDDGNPVGFTSTKIESYFLNIQKSFGKTIFVQLGFTGSFRFRISAVYAVDGSTIADCKLKDVYGINRNTPDHYENVTVIRSKTIGTDGALSLKERKLNCLVTRRLKLNGTGALVATKSAAQALINIALDEKIGRRQLVDIDVAQILNEESKVKTYFANDAAAEFSYTIDDPNLSFEEIAGMVASTVFCEPNRFGSKIQLQLEQPQENAVLLFNHRNKVPKSEKRTESWGVQNKYDGVEIEYTSPTDDTRIKYIASEKANPTNLMSIKSTGIRNEAQAKTRAWREWNKIKYQSTSVQFDALDESEILLRNDKIIVADNTSIETQDGEVREVDGLILVLSQDVVFEENQSYKVYLQLENGSVDMIDCFATEWTNEITLARPPQMPLVTEDGKYIKTTYQIVKAQEAELSAFMLTEMSPQGVMTNSLTAVNYTDKYYEKDHSFF